MSSRPRRGVCHTNNRDFLDETTCIAIGLIGLIVLVIVYMVKGKFNKKSLDSSGPRKSKDKKKALDIHMLSNCSKRRHNLYINHDSQRAFDEMQVKCLTYGNAQSSSKNNADMPFRNGQKKKHAYYTKMHADIVESGHGKSLHFNKISETQCAIVNSITKDSNNHRILNEQNSVNDVELQQCSSEKRSISKIRNLNNNDSHLQSMNSHLTESILSSYGFSKLQSKSSQCQNQITENLKSPKVSDRSVLKRNQSKEEGNLLKNVKSKEYPENKKIKKRLESNIFQDMKSKCCKSKIKTVKSKDKRAKPKPSHITNFIVLPSRSELQSTVSINTQSPNPIHNDHQARQIISSTIQIQTPSSTSGSQSANYSDLSKNSTSMQPQSQILNGTETKHNNSRCTSGNTDVNLNMSTVKSDGLKQFLDCATIQQQNVNLDDCSKKDLKLSQHSINKYISDCSNIVNVVEYKKFQLECLKQRSVLSKNHNLHDEDKINSQITIRSFIPQQDNNIYHQSRNSNRNFALLEILNNEIIEQTKNSISSIPLNLTQNTQKDEEKLISLQILESRNQPGNANSNTTSGKQALASYENESNTKKEAKNKIAPAQSVPQKAGWSIRKMFKYRPKKQ